MKNKQQKLLILVLGVASVLWSSCDQGPVARPEGYLRIGLPSADYEMLALPGFPYQFQKNQSATFTIKDSAQFWGNLYYPTLRSTVQLTYKAVGENDLEELVRDAQQLAYKHTVKASGMREQLFNYPEKSVSGMYYEMSGESASTTQFYATDSTSHFLRGVLYHYSTPKPDSLAPVTNFIREEIIELLNSLEWAADSTAEQTFP